MARALVGADTELDITILVLGQCTLQRISQPASRKGCFTFTEKPQRLHMVGIYQSWTRVEFNH